ncbi:glycosyltransferase [Pseudooceanicola sp. 200-1SW]|uniref:glycosyltransferase n=1 Tax=Pseudooceanicola sp. 200-1SW TaxID=3425949 RepID=UPI003D7F9D37
MTTLTLSLRLGRRFVQILSEEGLRSAWRRSRLWLRRALHDQAPSQAAGAGTARRGPDEVQAFWHDSATRGAFRVASPPVLRQRRKVAMIGDLNLPQCRKYRVEQLAEILALTGADYSYAHYEDLPRCMDILQDATHLFLYRLRSQPVVTRHLYEARRLRLPILYDIDDPLFSVPAYAGYQNMTALPRDLQQHFLAEAPFIAEVMNLADAVSVSTPGLQDHARDFTPRPVFLRRNFADRATLAAPPRSARAPGEGGLRLCFASGSHGHEVDFATIAPQVQAVLQGDPTRRLVILGHFDRAHLPPDLHPQIEQHAFTDYHSYLSHLAGCDLALMPLADDLFNRCKSAVRVIDAASVGLPSLVSPVSDMAAMVREGETGHVVPQGGDWAEALEALAADPARLAHMGAQARADLETRWAARLDAPVTDPELIRWVMA